jgi:hypothetical protein
MGRPDVRDITASMSASYHMFSAPAAPAPSAMARIAVTATAGLMTPGAATRPTKAVKTASAMTRGFRRAKKSPAVAPPMGTPASLKRLSLSDISDDHRLRPSA